MFFSVIFPVADFRALHVDSVGRLSKPRWGEIDPQAKFARGFGSINARTKSGNGFVGENYYADCNNFIRYPENLFFSPIFGSERNVLCYPIYRRFFYDGKTAGRFELGFRLNEATVRDVLFEARTYLPRYDILKLSRSILTAPIQINLLDGRYFSGKFLQASSAILDAYIWSTTKSDQYNQYVASGICRKYVTVGSPYVFVRSGNQTPAINIVNSRLLYAEKFRMSAAMTGLSGRVFDTAIIESEESLDAETHYERFARLFYVQMRAIAFSHSFYVSQIDKGEFLGASALQQTVSAMLDQLKSLQPLENDTRDSEVCSAMSSIVKSSDLDPVRLSAELETRFRPGIRSKLRKLLPYLDKKLDVAIEAAASTATERALAGGL